MRRLKPLALWCALLASPLAAQVDLPVSSPHQTAAVTAVRPTSPAGPQFYFAARPQRLDGHRILTFEVRLNGKPHLKESVFLETAANTGNAFALLAERPDLRVRLARIAAKPANRLEIQISVDQDVIRQFASWQSFLVYNQKLVAAGVTPRKAFSLVLDQTNHESEIRNVNAEGMQADPYCADLCYEDYLYCVEHLGQGTFCDDRYNRCIYNCPVVCVEPKSQTTSTNSQNWNGPTSTGNSGCYQGYYYIETVTERKHTTTTTTTHCDNTTSTSTQVSYSYRYCWQSTPYTCSFQDLWWVGCSGY